MNDKVTIKDIAEATGVSRGTVDRVLNNREGVAEETRKKVMNKIKELNYRPNKLAKFLALQNTYDLRVIIPSMPEVFYSQVREGIKTAHDELKDFGIRVNLYPDKITKSYPEKKFIEQAITAEADGIVILPIKTELMKEPINKAVKKDIPVVTLISDLKDSERVCYVGLNNIKGGRLAGELMGKLLNGYGKVAVFVNYLFNSCNYKRYSGFTEVINNYPDIDIVSKLENEDEDEIAYKKTEYLLETYPDLSGIFVTNVCSGGVAKALMDNDLQGKIRLIGFDITEEISRFLKKGVIYATIWQDPFNQGYQAMRCLYEYVIEGKKPASEILTKPRPIFIESLSNY